MSATGYGEAGVRGQGEALSSVVRHLAPTFTFPEDVEVLTQFGAYSSVLKIADDLAVALAIDGVGSKTIVAAAMDRYDTIGFDCVAMNVNDVICVGARPVAMVDYLGVNTLDPARADDILRGLGAAAKEAGVAIPGGELAQLPEVIGSAGDGPSDPSAFDLVGACVGIVHPDRLLLGGAIEPGDALIGIGSSGIHSNGLTLARRVLQKDAGYRLDDEIGRLGRTLGEELLEPTKIYVRAVTALWSAGIQFNGLVHVTGDGFANLCRLEAEVGYVIDDLLSIPPIFELIADVGGIEPAEMYRVFNMGIGFIVVVPAESLGSALECVAAAGYGAARIGSVASGPRAVRIEAAGLVGVLEEGESFFRPA